MKLHGNAALSWHGRRRLAERVLEEGWTLTAAAEAAGVSVRCARKWVGSLPPRGRDRDSTTAPRRPGGSPTARPPERVEAILVLRRLRFTAAEIADTLGWRSRPSPGSSPDSAYGRLGRLGLEQPVRYERSRPGELVHVDVKQLGRIEGGAGKRAFAGERRQQAQPAPHRRRGHPPPPRRLRVRARLRRRLQPASPTPRCSPTRRRRPRSASCNARSPSTAVTASGSSGC